MAAIRGGGGLHRRCWDSAMASAAEAGVVVVVTVLVFSVFAGQAADAAKVSGAEISPLHLTASSVFAPMGSEGSKEVSFFFFFLNT